MKRGARRASPKPDVRLETLRDWLRFAVSRFNQAQLSFGHGTANAWDEAIYLLLHTLHLQPDQLETFLDARLTAAEARVCARVIDRRVKERVPAAYLTHEAWLGEHRFFVDQRVIVPRSYIAHFLDELGAPWITDADRIERALDLCTGSGCLAILAALAFPNTHVDATDLSKDALAVARINVTDYGLDDRIRLLRSDLFAALEGQRYNLIVSNPPYVPAAAMRALPAEYRREPRQALASGVDGLDHIRAIVRQAADYLAPEGLLVVECGAYRENVEAAFQTLPFVWLDSPSGDGFVFLLRREDLRR